MTGEEFYRKRMNETNWPKNDLCDPPTDPRMAIHILIDHFLGKDWSFNGVFRKSSRRRKGDERIMIALDIL